MTAGAPGPSPDHDDTDSGDLCLGPTKRDAEESLRRRLDERRVRDDNGLTTRTLLVLAGASHQRLDSRLSAPSFDLHEDLAPLHRHSPLRLHGRQLTSGPTGTQQGIAASKAPTTWA